MRRQIAGADLIWLHMDSPQNLMQINSLMVLDAAPDWDQLTAVIQERIVDRYQVMSEHPVHHLGRWYWETDHNFKLERHLIRVELDRPATLDNVREHLAKQLSKPFDRNHPLWQFQLITGPDADGPAVCALRVHHCVADGIRLVQLFLGLCEADPSLGETKRGSSRAQSRAAALANRWVSDSLELARGAMNVYGKIPGTVASTLNPLNLPHNLETAIGLVRHPVRISDAITTLAGPENELTNTVSETGRILLSERADHEVWTNPVGTEKDVCWVTDISLAEVKRIGASLNGTVNDVVMAVVSRALGTYLEERGIVDTHEVSWLMPVSLQPFDHNLPATLGNHFSLVLMPMPLGIEDNNELIRELAIRTTRIKHSAEPLITFGMQWAMAETPHSMAKSLSHFFAHKGLGQLTNVPGPKGPVTIAGTPVRGVVGWVPMTGDQALSVCVFSYNGQVSMGLSCDKATISNLDRLAELLRESCAALLSESTGEDRPDGPEGRDGPEGQDLPETQDGHDE